MSNKLIPIFLFSAALGLSACGKKETVIKPLGPNNPIITGKVTNPSQEEVQNFLELKNKNRKVYEITLKEDALKQQFLLTAAAISGVPTPAGRAMANKIVFFKKKGGSIFMFESLDGKLSTDDVATKVLLAEFPITEETSDSVTFDFKKGMKLLFEKGSYFVSDSQSKDEGDSVYTITDSYINSVELRGEHIFIDQIVRVDVPAQSGKPANNFNRHLKYTLSTYKKNPDFPSKASNKQKKVGYFEVHPILEAGTGKETINVLKYDISKPVTFHVTPNVPTEYREAINDGILYWNRVFGKKVLKVDTLPKDISVHEPGYNIVQWLHWDTAGMAYANMTGDPLTGEIFQSHVYMTSVFGNGGYKRAKTYLERFKAMSKSKLQNAEKFSLKIAGFQDAHVCSFTYDQSMHNLAEILQKTEEAAAQSGEISDATKEKIFKRFAKDYVREVVAHEVGHSLGFRHNFAGSLKTNIDPKVYDTVAKHYFLTGELLPGMIPAGTVMDYTPSMIASMIGAHIRLKRPGLSYDKQAIEFGYTKKTVDQIEIDTFCTDSHRGKGTYLDCKIWDQFANPFDAANFDMKNAIPFKAFALADLFSFIDPRNVDEKKEEKKLTNLEKINKVNLNPRAEAAKLIKENLAPLIAMTTPKAQFIDIRNDYEYFGSLEQEEYEEKTRAFQSESVQRLGGLTKLFIAPLTPVPFKDSVAVQFAAKLSKEFERQFKRLYPMITQEEANAIEAKMAPFFEAFEKEIAINIVNQLNEQTFAMREKGFGEALTKAIDTILFKTKDEIVGTSTNGLAVKEYLYQFESDGTDLREKAAKLAMRDFFPFSPSYKRAQDKRTKALKQKHTDLVTAIVENTTEDDISDELYDWLTIEKKRLKVLK